MEQRVQALEIFAEKAANAIDSQFDALKARIKELERENSQLRDEVSGHP